MSDWVTSDDCAECGSYNNDSVWCNECVDKLIALICELELALRVASIQNTNGGWSDDSPFQQKINDLLTKASKYKEKDEE